MEGSIKGLIIHAKDFEICLEGIVELFNEFTHMNFLD